MAAEEHRVPTVSRLELGGSPRGRGRRERKEWGESFRPRLLKGAHLVGDQQDHLLLGGDPPRVCQEFPFPESSMNGSVEESVRGSKRGRGWGSMTEVGLKGPRMEGGAEGSRREGRGRAWLRIPYI